MTTTCPGDFTPQADAYARARPGYPCGLVELLTELLDVPPGAAVADVGAGTGIFTEILARRELRVTAIEPNATMRARAPALDGVVWRDGTFEATGLADGSQAWILAAQAFHWADPARALPELRRALAPCGRLTVLWNNRDNAASPVLTFTRELILERVPGFDEGYRHRDWWSVLTSTGDFGHAFEVDVPHVVVMDAERYLDLWRSHNLLNAAAGPELMRGLLDAIRERLGDVERVEVPYVCRAWTVTARR